jgi:hypothetical protein
MMENKLKNYTVDQTSSTMDELFNCKEDCDLYYGDDCSESCQETPSTCPLLNQAHNKKIVNMKKSVSTIKELEHPIPDGWTPSFYMDAMSNCITNLEVKLLESEAKLKACYKVIDNDIPILEDKLRVRVPFEVLQKECTKYKCKYWCDARGCFCDIKQNCPLIPKVKIIDENAWGEERR